MMPWEKALGANQVAKVVAFVMSHHTAPAPGDAPPPEENK